METEKLELLQLNLELQKRASNLLFREKVKTTYSTAVVYSNMCDILWTRLGLSTNLLVFSYFHLHIYHLIIINFTSYSFIEVST